MIMLMIYALIMTLALAVVHIFMKQKPAIWIYPIMYVLFFLGLLLSRGTAQAEEICVDGMCYEYTHEMTEDAIRDINEFKYFIAKRIYMGPRNGIERKDYASLIKFHKGEAERTFADAKARCWILPKLTDRQNAQYCFGAIAALVAPVDPMSKLVGVITATLILYGIDCCDEWHYINNKLYWSQYHYEMMEFYEEALRKS